MIKLTVQNLAQWIGFLKTIPAIAKPAAIEAFSRFMLDKLRNYPKYQYVSRKTAYGYTFKSAKQRAWFWANGGPAMIGNHRSYRLQAGWKMEAGGSKTYIINNVPYAGWVVGSGQARQPGLVGWQKVWDVIINNMSAGIAAAQAAVMAKLGAK